MTYTQKLQSALIDTGKAVEKAEKLPTPTISVMDVLYDKFKHAEATGDMTAMAQTSKDLIAGLVKWRVEKL
jgi:hypothetical protein